MTDLMVLVDTGPIVAYLNGRDRHHAWAVECWKSLTEPLVTCEAVLSEVVFLLQSEGAGPEPMLQLIERGLVRLDFSLADHAADVFGLLRKYRDRPMRVADACLVRMAELARQPQVFTTDRDFLVYRRKGRQTIPLLSPFA